MPRARFLVRLSTALLSCLVVVVWASAALAAAGDLDPLFDGDGRLVTPVPASPATGVAVQNDGGIVVVGYSSNGSNLDFRIHRYLSGGALDPSFSDDGMRMAFSGIMQTDRAWDVAVQPDGKIVVAGESGGDFAIMRFTQNGSFDLTFSGDGRVKTDFGAQDVATAIALTSDGKIVAGGYTGPGDNSRVFALARYTAAGVLDSTFSRDGRQSLDFASGAGDEVTDLELVGGGAVIAVGFTDQVRKLALARFMVGGTPDPTFDGDGRVTTDLPTPDEHLAAVELGPQGTVVVGGTAGSGDPDFLLARYTAGGALDTSFSGDGFQIIDFSSIATMTDLATQSDGKLVGVGTMGVLGSRRFAVARYKVGGALDTTFSGDGKVTTTFPTEVQANAGTLQPNGKIVVAGVGGGWALARYLAA